MLHRFGKFRRPVALVMLSVFLVAQLLLPLTARAFFFGGVSLKDEKEMGHKFDVAIRSSLPMVDDPEVSKYVDGLVRRLVDLLAILFRLNTRQFDESAAGSGTIFTGHNVDCTAAG